MSLISDAEFVARRADRDYLKGIKAGDKVICQRNLGSNYLVKGKVYTVRYRNGSNLYLEDREEWFYCARFAFATPRTGDPIIDKIRHLNSKYSTHKYIGENCVQS